MERLGSGPRLDMDFQFLLGFQIIILLGDLVEGPQTNFQFLLGFQIPVSNSLSGSSTLTLTFNSFSDSS